MPIQEAPASTNIWEQAQQELESISREARDVGELRRKLSQRLGKLSTENQGELYDLLAQQHRELEEATRGFSAVRLAHNLPEHIGGQNVIGGGEASAEVSSKLLKDPTELRRTLIHEADPEVGHCSQAQPHVQNEEAALMFKYDPLSTTAVLEGDVERGTAKKMEGNASSRRPGQPGEKYGEGQSAANEIITLLGEETWNRHLKGDGDYASLQEAIWKEQLRSGRRAEEVMHEADRTGYRQQAQAAIGAIDKAA